MSDVSSASGSGAATTGSGAPPAKEQAKEATSAAVAKTGEVASSAGDGAKKVASEATRQVSDLASEASGHAKEVYSQASGQLREQASEQTGRAAEGVRSLSQQVQALADGRPDDAGAVGEYARQAGDRLQQVATRLEDGGLDGVLEDLQRFARRRPGLFLLGAGAAGLAAGRLLRGAQAAGTDSPDTSAAPQRIGRLGRADGPFADVPAGGAPGAVVPPVTADLSVVGAEAVPSGGTTPGSRP